MVPGEGPLPCLPRPPPAPRIQGCAGRPTRHREGFTYRGHRAETLRPFRPACAPGYNARMDADGRLRSCRSWTQRARTANVLDDPGQRRERRHTKFG